MNKKDFDALKKRMDADAERHFIGIDLHRDDTSSGGKEITLQGYRPRPDDDDEEGQSSPAPWSKKFVCPADDPNLEERLKDAIRAAALELYPGKPAGKR
jgi:hypothetical protein